MTKTKNGVAAYKDHALEHPAAAQAYVMGEVQRTIASSGKLQNLWLSSMTTT